MNNSMYWSPDKLLSYNYLFNYVIGERGNGKSFAAKKYGINKFLKTGKQFIYLRRYGSEIKKIKSSKEEFFKDLDKYFPNRKFDIQGDKMLIDGKVFGYLAFLSVSDNYKSIPFPDVDTIIYDEFIIENIKIHHYLDDEVNKFLSFYDSIARTRDIKVLFLANAVTMNNPHFLYWNISQNGNKQFSVFKEIDSILEITDCKQYKEFRANTRFGKMIKNTSYGRYALENKFLLDNNNFIEKKTGQCKYVCTLFLDSYKIGIWQNKDMLLFCSFDIQNNNINISMSLNAHTENTILGKSNYLINEIKRSYLNGNLFFENQKVKGVMMSVLKTLI